MLKNGKKVIGTVMDIVSGPGRSVGHYPVIRFDLADGKYVMKQYEVGKRNYGYKIGDDIEVIYNIDNPEEFIINDITTKVIGPAFIIAGLVVFAACTFYLFFMT